MPRKNYSENSQDLGGNSGTQRGSSDWALEVRNIDEISVQDGDVSGEFESVSVSHVDHGSSNAEVPSFVTLPDVVGNAPVPESVANLPDWAPGQAMNSSCVQFNAGQNRYTISEGSTAAILNELIENAEPGASFLFKDGTHEFTETIKICRDDVTLAGESEEGTIIDFDFPDGVGGNGFEITGGEKSQITELEYEAEAGSCQVVLNDISGISAGDTLYFSQPNTLEYLLENGWDNVSLEDAATHPFREVIVRVESIDGNTVTLCDPLPYDFDGGLTEVYDIDLLENIVLENFTVTSGLDADPNYYDFVNTYPEFSKKSVICVTGADGICLSGISILDAPSSAFDFRSTIDLQASDLYVNGAHNLGGDGNGYGINLYETFYAEITDVEIYNVRHSVLFSSWNAEAGNYVEVTATNRDINFHGSPDTGNEVYVLSSILDYDPSQNTGTTNGFWDIVSGGGSKHANTDIFDTNSVVFKHAEGSQGSEIILGADGGAYLDGNGSQDLIIGGSGDDIIIGGTSRDELIGGDGADTFVFNLGDSYDTIFDFSGDLEGDRIYITGNPDLLSFDDLQIFQNGDDAYIRYGANSTIILAGFDASQLHEDQFIIDPYDDGGIYA